MPKNIILALFLTLVSSTAPAVEIPTGHPATGASPQDIVNHELAFQSRELSPDRLIISVTDVCFRKNHRLGGIPRRKEAFRCLLRSQWQSFRFDPGIALKAFSPRELSTAGITDRRSVSTLDLDRLLGAVANGGLLMPARSGSSLRREPRPSGSVSWILWNTNTAPCWEAGPTSPWPRFRESKQPGLPVILREILSPRSLSDTSRLITPDMSARLWPMEQKSPLVSTAAE